MTRRAWVHTILAALWALAAVPTLLWWSDSILWVLMISLYANVVGHVSAVEAARVPQSADEP